MCKIHLGDVAFACTDDSIADRLFRWAYANDSGNPRSVEDLTEVEFADVMKDKPLPQQKCRAVYGGIPCQPVAKPGGQLGIDDHRAPVTMGALAIVAAEVNADMIDAECSDEILKVSGGAMVTGIDAINTRFLSCWRTGGWC